MFWHGERLVSKWRCRQAVELTFMVIAQPSRAGHAPKGPTDSADRQVNQFRPSTRSAPGLGFDRLGVAITRMRSRRACYGTCASDWHKRDKRRVNLRAV